MAFLETGWGKSSVSLNEPILTLEGGTVVGSPAQYTYQSATDNKAAIAAADYFASKAIELCVGDSIYFHASDGPGLVYVSAVTQSPMSVTTSNVVTSGGGGLPTTLAQNYIYMGNSAGNAEAVHFTAGNVSILWGATGQAGAVISASSIGSNELEKDIIQYKKTSLTSAQVLGMFAAPVQVINTFTFGVVILRRAVLHFKGGTTSYADGGNIFLQYGGGATPSTYSTQISAATFNALSAEAWLSLEPIAMDVTGMPSIADLAITNDTGAFTTGDWAIDVHLWYSLLSAF
jgi:hypothetical protein